MSWIGMLIIRELFGLEESIFIPAMTGMESGAWKIYHK